jgi:glycine dehydrogenase subunit 1
VSRAAALTSIRAVSRYTSATDADREAMLAAIGVESIDDLFADIPPELRLDRPLDLPDGRSETEVFDELRALAARNADADSELCFLGAGMYDHYVPAIVDAITQRSEFLTPYTPYQPEVSQGGLQVMFEFQTAISELTALPVANASLYEGPSSVASAAYLALGARPGRTRFVTSRGLHPHARATLTTYARGFGAEVEEVGLDGGVTDAEALAGALDDSVAAVLVQSPNFLGAVEDLEALAGAAHDAGALFVASVDAVTLGILRPPGECGVDVAVGEGQPLGNRLDYGGPSFGFFAATEEHLRRMPGRIAGETTDVDGRRGFVLALQTREQHIRREKATHNICTSQALNALAGTVYLAWLGKRGIVELGELLARRTAYARERLAAVDGVDLLHEAPVVREFAIRVDAPVDAVLDACAEDGIAAGYPLGHEYPEHEDGLLVAITERRSREDIDRLAESLGRAVGQAARAVREGAPAREVPA